MKGGALRATLLIAMSACCFGSISPLTVLALRTGAALPAVQAWRYLTTAVLLMAWAWWRRPSAPVPSGVAPWYSWRVLVVAGGGQAAVATFALLALRWIPTSTEAFLFYTYPAWVTIIAAARGVERIDRIRLIALVLALGGIAIMVGAPDAASLHPLGVASVMSASVIYALYIPILNNLQRDRQPLDVARAIGVGGSVIFFVWAAISGTVVAHFDATVVMSSVLQGVLSAGAFLGFLAGLSQLGAVRTAITSTVEPFWTSLLGVVLLGQPVGRGTLIGGAAIMGAVLLLQRPSVAQGQLHSSTAHTGGPSGRPTP